VKLFQGKETMEKLEIEKVFSKWNNADTPGGAIAVIQNDVVTHRYGYGMADLEENISFTPKTKTRIASISKQFTTTCILLLKKNGRLQLDDRVKDYIPELEIPGPSITIRHLCQNTSGLRDQLNLALMAGGDYDRGFTKSITDRLIKGQHSLNFAPGDQYRYSNTNFVILSWIIERLTKKSLADVFYEWIFKPLGMHDSELIEMTTQKPEGGAATGYIAAQQGGFKPSGQALSFSGDGGIYSTLDDMILWEKNFDHNILGSPHLLDELIETKPLNNGKANFYALGLMLIDFQGEQAQGHAGGLQGYKAFRIRFPDGKLSIITLSNRGDTSAIELSIAASSLFLKQPVTGIAAKKIENKNERLEKFAGYFQNPKTGLGAQIAIDPSGLTLRICGKDMPMEALNQNCFKSGLASADWPVSLELGQTPDKILLSQGCGNPEEFFRPPVGEYELDEYCGEYQCTELETIYQFRVDNGSLVIDIQGPGGQIEGRVLQQAAQDSFLMDIQSEGVAVLWFSRNKQGKIKKLMVSGDRAQGLIFKIT